MWLKICADYDVHIIDKPLIQYLQHGGNITGNKIRNRREKRILFENEILTYDNLRVELGDEFLYKLQRMYCSLGKMYAKNSQKEEAEHQFSKALNYRINPYVTMKTHVYRLMNSRR